MDKIFSQLKKIDLKKYGPVPFWSWNNKIEPVEAVRQIREMKKNGLGGFIIHARQGLKTPYLSEEWFDAVGACLEEAQTLGMCVWIYDEFGYPSGFIGGKLFKDEKNRAPYLEYEVGDVFDPSAFVVYGEENGKYFRLSGNEEYYGKYHTIYRRRSPSEVDILDPNVVSQFIKGTHEEYYKRFKKYFGKSVRGFFTDEPQYYRYKTPITNVIEKEFFDEYGENVTDGLINLFLNDESAYPFRVKYYTLMNKLYTEHFYKALYEWCDAHGCELTGHSVEEPHLNTQMWGGAGCMPSYEFCQVPGIDHLCRTTDGVADAIQVESVASQLGKKQIMTESFGCSGFDVSPRELKYLCDYQYVNGVNYMVYHLMNYSLQSQGYSDFPPSFSSHAPWWKDFKYFNRYVAQLGYIISETDEKADVLVIHPMRDVYLTYDRDNSLESVKEVDEKFHDFTCELSQKGVGYHFGDERIISRYGKVENGTAVIGNRKYKYVILPNMKNISANTYKFVKEFRESGGKLCVIGKFPKYIDGNPIKEQPLQGNVILSKLIKATAIKIKNVSDAKVLSRYCSGKIGEFAFIVNTEEEKSATLKLDRVYSVIDLVNGEKYRVEGELVLPPRKSVLLKKERSVITEKPLTSVKEVTEDFRIRKISENNLIVDFARYSFGGRKWSESLYTAHLVDELLRAEYKGKLYVKYNFTVKDRINELKLLTQNNDIEYVKLNGKKLRFGNTKYDVNFRVADISSAIVVGENELIFKVDFKQNDFVRYAIYGENVTPSLRNMMTYDTVIEPVFIQGNFNVADGNIIVKRNVPEDFSDINAQGYKFFSGEMILSGVVDCDEDGFYLQLNGNYMSADVTVNGLESATLILDDKVKIKKGVTKGKNQVDITVKSSMRNMYGPHHVKGMQEWWGVHPGMFTFVGEWKNGIPETFDNGYSTVKFGLDSIKIIY